MHVDDERAKFVNPPVDSETWDKVVDKAQILNVDPDKFHDLLLQYGVNAAKAQIGENKMVAQARAHLDEKEDE